MRISTSLMATLGGAALFMVAAPPLRPSATAQNVQASDQPIVLAQRGERGERGGNAGGGGGGGGDAISTPRGAGGGGAISTPRGGGSGGSAVQRSRPDAGGMTRSCPRMGDRGDRVYRGWRGDRGTVEVVPRRGRGDRPWMAGRRYSWGPGVGFYFWNGYYYGDCRWLRRRAIETGSAYWWRRYRLCRDYD